MFRSFEKYEGTLYSSVLVFFFLFSTRNHVPQKLIEMGRIIYHINFLSVEKNRFDFVQFRANEACVKAYNKLFKLNFSRQVKLVRGVFKRHIVNQKFQKIKKI